MRIHYASTFAYQKFQDEIRSIVEQVDKKNFQSIKFHASAAIRKMSQAKAITLEENSGQNRENMQNELTWPLAEHGQGPLPNEDEIKNVTYPSEYELGDWFLIILAQYLQPSTSPLGNWSVLEQALAKLGWVEQDRELLFLGYPTYKLLKPSLEENKPWPITAQSPYWLWLHPHHSRAGWLTIEKIQEFQVRLLKMKRKIETFDVGLIPGINCENPVVVEEYKKYLEFAYQDTLAMLSNAQSLEQGLFMSVWFG